MKRAENEGLSETKSEGVGDWLYIMACNYKGNENDNALN